MVIANVKLIMGKNTRDADEASPELHRCMGRFVAATQEPDSTQLFNTSICKTTGSCDPLTTRALYKNTVEFEFNTLLVINWNSRSRLRIMGRACRGNFSFYCGVSHS